MRAPVLDEQQRTLLREAMQKHRDEMLALDETLRAAQKELVKATVAEKPDEKLIREKADAMAKIQSDQTVLRAKIFAVVAPTLKPEQREQIESNPFAMNMMMGSAGGGMRPMMGPSGAPPPQR